MNKKTYEILVNTLLILLWAYLFSINFQIFKLFFVPIYAISMILIAMMAIRKNEHLSPRYAGYLLLHTAIYLIFSILLMGNRIFQKSGASMARSYNLNRMLMKTDFHSGHQALRGGRISLAKHIYHVTTATKHRQRFLKIIMSCVLLRSVWKIPCC